MHNVLHFIGTILYCFYLSTLYIPFVSLICFSRDFMYSKSSTIDLDRSSKRLSSTSNGFNFSALASYKI